VRGQALLFMLHPSKLLRLTKLGISCNSAVSENSKRAYSAHEYAACREDELSLKTNLIYSCSSASENWAKAYSSYTAVFLGPLCPLCERLPLASFPSTCAPISAHSIIHCHICWLYPEQILISASSDMHHHTAEVNAR
jgi:hypothetical protein